MCTEALRLFAFVQDICSTLHYARSSLMVIHCLLSGTYEVAQWFSRWRWQVTERSGLPVFCIASCPFRYLDSISAVCTVAADTASRSQQMSSLSGDLRNKTGFHGQVGVPKCQ